MARAKDNEDDLRTALWLEALKIAEKQVGSRVKSQRVAVRQQALLEVAALASSPEIKKEALKRVLARQLRQSGGKGSAQE